MARAFFCNSYFVVSTQALKHCVRSQKAFFVMPKISNFLWPPFVLTIIAAATVARVHNVWKISNVMILYSHCCLNIPKYIKSFLDIHCDTEILILKGDA